MQKSGVSAALWIPFVWYFLAASRSVSRWVNPQGFYFVKEDYLEGAPLDRNFSIVLIIVAGLILSRRMRGHWKDWFIDNKYLVALLLFMAVSISWSHLPIVSTKRWIKTVGAVMMVMVIMTERDQIKAIESLLKRAFIIILPLSLVFIKYYRVLGVAWSKDGQNQMWVGITTHKNQLGQVCFTAALFFLWNMIRTGEKRRFLVSLPLFLLSIVLMNGPGYSRSTTSILVLFVGITVLLGLGSIRHSPEKARSKILGGVIVLAFIFLLLQLAADGFTNRSALSVALEASGRDVTLTGRTILWADIIGEGAKHPLIGAGFGSFWVGDLGNDLWIKHPWKPRQGHNGFVDVFVELGFIGLFLLFCLIASRWKTLLKELRDNFEFGRFRLSVFIMLLIHNMTESSFLRGSHNLWFLFLLVAMSFKLKAKTTAEVESV